MQICASTLVAWLLFPQLLFSQAHVRGHFRSNGTYVAPHYRSAPNGSRFDNWSTQGNINPFTGKVGTKDPYPTTWTNPFPSLLPLQAPVPIVIPPALLEPTYGTLNPASVFNSTPPVVGTPTPQLAPKVVLYWQDDEGLHLKQQPGENYFVAYKYKSPTIVVLANLPKGEKLKASLSAPSRIRCGQGPYNDRTDGTGYCELDTQGDIFFSLPVIDTWTSGKYKITLETEKLSTSSINFEIL